mmetsp:Transcript_5967/g.13054  ORF Transcript_5967/g.13054 Transcript_5967/m.13054 type:complete len:351 (-) Transcript_5967:1538-2590(-)
MLGASAGDVGMQGSVGSVGTSTSSLPASPSVGSEGAILLRCGAGMYVGDSGAPLTIPRGSGSEAGETAPGTNGGGRDDGENSPGDVGAPRSVGTGMSVGDSPRRPAVDKFGKTTLPKDASCLTGSDAGDTAPETACAGSDVGENSPGEVGAPMSVGTGSSEGEAAAAADAANTGSGEAPTTRTDGVAAATTGTSEGETAAKAGGADAGDKPTTCGCKEVGENSPGDVGAPRSVGTGSSDGEGAPRWCCSPLDCRIVPLAWTVDADGAWRSASFGRLGGIGGGGEAGETPPGTACGGSEVGENSPGEVGAPRSVGTGNSDGEDCANTWGLAEGSTGTMPADDTSGSTTDAA